MPTMPIPAVIYARYSTDRQRETSIEDQARVCRTRAEALHLQIVAVHADDEVSGSTPVASRRGGKALLADVLAGRFQVLLLEGLDRLSRDQVEQETIIRRLEHRGIRIVGCSDGYDSAAAGRKLHRGMRGLINEIYLDDLRDKVHRGLAGQVERGFHAGGISFGYRSVGDERGHRLEIDTEAAEWVRWIFTRYAEGWSCQRIAAELNRQHVRSPRGTTWAVSALYGSPAKGSGVLNNELYIGRYVWNRSQWVKEPDTGKRQRLVRPRQEWCVAERPELRILSDELWSAARARMDKPRASGGGKGRGAAPRTLFGGLLRCGRCGGAIIAVDQRTYGCAACKDRGTAVCSGIRARRSDVDDRLLGVVKEELLAPEAIVEVEHLVREISSTAASDQAKRKQAIAARLAELDREIGNLVQAIAKVGISLALEEGLFAAERERSELKQESARASQNPREMLHVVPSYKRFVMDLQNALERDPTRARAMLQEIFGRIRLVERDEGIYAEFEAPLERLLLAAGGALPGRVAGEGFEPSTFGL
jgi:DNA invertase Pin-like site-specific DNA recombinase